MTRRRFSCLAFACATWMTLVRAGDEPTGLQLTLNFEVDDCAAFQETAVLEAYCEAFVEEADFPKDTACLTDQSECPANEASRRRRLLSGANEDATIVLAGTFGDLTDDQVLSTANGILSNSTRLETVQSKAVGLLNARGTSDLANLLQGTGVTGGVSSVQDVTVQCTSSAGCTETPTRPICQSNFCVACSPIALPAERGNCPSDQFCRSDGSCSGAQCETDDDCWGVTPICDENQECTSADFEVSNEADLKSALDEADPGQSIQVVGEITLTTGDVDTPGLTIGKAISIVGKRDSVLQSPADDTAAIIFISVEADDVSFSKGLRIRHLKVDPSSIVSAIEVNGNNFVSAANVEFVEFGYSLRGSFAISGSTEYVGALENRHRHIAIYSMTASSSIQDVRFSFPNETTPLSNVIFVNTETPGSVPARTFDGGLTVRNVIQDDLSIACRQFFNYEAGFENIVPANSSLSFDGNAWNDLNGGIFLIFPTDNPLQRFQFVSLTNNFQGNAAIVDTDTDYKGIFYVTASGDYEVGDVTSFSSSGNESPGQTDPSSLRAEYFWVNVEDQEENTLAFDDRGFQRP